MSQRIKAPGHAKYRGDVSQSIIGSVVGPTTYRTFLTAIEASYDAESDTTSVWFAQATMKDMDQTPGFAEFRGAA